MHANFHCGVIVTLLFCSEIPYVALVPLAKQPMFLCNQDIRACTMGCKRGLRGFGMKFYAIKKVKWPFSLNLWQVVSL